MNTHSFKCLIFLLLSAITSQTLAAPERLKRYAVIVAANNGGIDRTPLRYAETDALSLTKVLQELGGLQSNNRILLIEPSPEEILTAMNKIQEKIHRDKNQTKRSEFFFYYSGHSDEKGLLLGEKSLNYSRLKRALTSVSSDVQIAILDSCASGAFTRIKGGRHNPPFMQDESSDVKGYAFLTSSSATENAQESDAIGGSYFTHYFVSALRGAADTTLDKKVTLNEAYQYAFHETLSRTEQTLNGAQHAAYDFKLAGAGDLVLTELSQSVASIKLEKLLNGRLYIRNLSGRLMVEINKLPGVYMEVSLPPQTYLITLDNQGALYKTSFSVKKNHDNLLSSDQFLRVDPELTVARGNQPSRDNNTTHSKYNAFQHMSITHRIQSILEQRQKEIASYERIPIKLSLIPGVAYPSSTNKTKHPEQDIVTVDLQILGSDTDNANASGAYLVSTIKEDIIGGQGAVVASVVGGNLFGGQGSGVFSFVKGDIFGGQAAGVAAYSNGSLVGGKGAGIFAYTNGNVEGGQGAGAVSIVNGNITGGQGAGIVAIARGNVIGGQGAGVANIVIGNITGFQGSFFMNYAGGDVGGAQISGLTNISGGTSYGAQLAIINVSNYAKSTQLGFLNIAKKSDGIALGLLNIIGNGRFDIGINFDESEYNNLIARTGVNNIYSHLSIGNKIQKNINYTRVKWGIGINKKFRDNLMIDHEILLGSRFNEEDTLLDCNPCSHFSPLITIGSILSYSIVPEIQITAGMTLNFLQKSRRDSSENEQFFGKETNKIWPGASLGLQLSL